MPTSMTNTTDSILDTVKSFVNIPVDYDTTFDGDLIIFINSCLGVLAQIGVGSFNQQFKITGSDETWADFMGSYENIEAAKEYVCLRTKITFDPPQSSAVMEQMKEIIKEDFFRISVSVDPGDPIE